MSKGEKILQKDLKFEESNLTAMQKNNNIIMKKWNIPGINE